LSLVSKAYGNEALKIQTAAGRRKPCCSMLRIAAGQSEGDVRFGKLPEIVIGGSVVSTGGILRRRVAPQGARVV
jgi:hypothetical protein